MVSVAVFLARICPWQTWAVGRTRFALAVGIVLSLVAVPSASASTTIGQLFTPNASNCSTNSFFQTGVSSGTSYTVPVAGMITSWSFKHAAAISTGLKFKVVRSAGGNMYTVVGESTAGTQTANMVDTYPANIAVHAGDFIGIFVSGGGGCVSVGAPLTVADSIVGTLADDAPGSTTTYGSAGAEKVPVSAVVTALPTSMLTVPGCTQTGVLSAKVTADTPTTPKALHFKVDGGAEQVASTDATGAVSITTAAEGTHSVEYWGEDQLGQLESPHHTVSVVVDRTAPTLTITSDQGKTVYNTGDAASVTTKATDSGSGLASDPSGARQPISTTQAGSFSVMKSAADRCANVTNAVFSYTVNTGAGGGGGAVPVLVGLSASPSAFAAADSGASITRKRKTGTTIRYTDSQAATTTFTVLKSQPGVRDKHGACVKPRKGMHGKHCTRYVSIGSFIRNDVAGRDSFHLTGRLGGRKLKPGSYKLQALPRANGKTGRAATILFRIIK